MAPAESLDAVCDRRAARVAFNFCWVSSSSATMRLRIPSSVSVLSSRRKCAMFHRRTYSSRSLTAPTAYASAIERKKCATRARTARFPPPLGHLLRGFPEVALCGKSNGERGGRPLHRCGLPGANANSPAIPMDCNSRERPVRRLNDLQRTGTRFGRKRASAVAGGNRRAGFCRTRGLPTAAADPG